MRIVYRVYKSGIISEIINHISGLRPKNPNRESVYPLIETVCFIAFFGHPWHYELMGFSLHRLMTYALMITLSACTTAPKRVTPQTFKTMELDEQYTRAWDAADTTALNFPIWVRSKKDGYIESEWIYEQNDSRYRFFIHVRPDNPLNVDVYVQMQQLDNRDDWIWVMPGADIKEKLLRNIKAGIYKHEDS